VCKQGYYVHSLYCTDCTLAIRSFSFFLCNDPTDITRRGQIHMGNGSITETIVDALLTEYLYMRLSFGNSMKAWYWVVLDFCNKIYPGLTNGPAFWVLHSHTPLTHTHTHSLTHTHTHSLQILFLTHCCHTSFETLLSHHTYIYPFYDIQCSGSGFICNTALFTLNSPTHSLTHSLTHSQ
jgi:hypothetical protein